MADRQNRVLCAKHCNVLRYSIMPLVYNLMAVSARSIRVLFAQPCLHGAAYGSQAMRLCRNWGCDRHATEPHRHQRPGTAWSRQHHAMAALTARMRGYFLPWKVSWDSCTSENINIYNIIY